MRRARVVASLALVVLLFLTASYGQGVSRETQAVFNSDIRQVDFKNFNYVRPRCDSEQRGTLLRDSRHVSKDGAETSLMRVAYGDLTGDGSEEAVINLRGQDARVSRTLDEVFIYTLKSGRVVLLAHFEAGRRGEYVLSVNGAGSNFKIEDRLLILDQAILRLGEDVPTHYYTIKYRWDGMQMVEVERSDLKPLPEHMMEMG